MFWPFAPGWFFRSADTLPPERFLSGLLTLRPLSFGACSLADLRSARFPGLTSANYGGVLGQDLQVCLIGVYSVSLSAGGFFQNAGLA